MTYGYPVTELNNFVTDIMHNSKMMLNLELHKLTSAT